MAITDIDDLTRPLSDLVGEQGEKAARRKKQLAEVRATRAADMTADEAKAAAERGDFPGVEPSRVRGPLDLDEDIDQDTGPSFFDYAGAYFTDPRLSFIGAGVDLLGRTGAATAPYTENFLKTISQGGDNFIAKAGQFLFEDAANVAAKINAGTSFDELTPFEKLAIASVPAEVIPGLGLAPDILKLGRNFVINLGDDAAKLLDNYMVSKQAVTDTGIMMPIDNKPARVRGPSDTRGRKPGYSPLVDEKFLELFKNKPLAVDTIGSIKASNALNELLKLDEIFVLNAKKPELIKALEDKGLKFSLNQISRLRSLYKSFKGIEPLGTSRAMPKGVDQLINFDDPQVSNIMERLITGDLTKKDAAKALDKIYPGSGFVDISMDGKAGKPFKTFYESYIANLDDDVLKLLLETKKGTPKTFFDRLDVGDKIPAKASVYLKGTAIFDDTGKSFTQAKASFLNNNIANDLINKTKNLFQDKSIKLFDVDHIQAPRFGGTNAESNFRLITKADHNSLKTLPSYKTLATDVVKAKTGFENDYYKLSTKLVDNVKNNNFEAADKIAESLRVMVDNFKNTYKNVDFVVGAPHVAIKTGDNTAKYIKYGDDIKLTNKQKKYIEDNNLLPTQSNLPNAGKSIEKQAEDIYQGYLQIYNLIGEIPSGSIGKVAGNIKSMDVPLPRDVVVRKEFSGLRDGGIVDIFKMTRPLNAER